MARKNKGNNGAGTAVTLEQAGVTVDVGVEARDDNGSHSAAEGTHLPTTATAVAPKKRTRAPSPPRRPAALSGQQERRADELIAEATVQAKALHDEATQVREQLQSAVVEARQRADEALRLIEEARQEVDLARKQYVGTAREGQRALDEVLQLQSRAVEECRQLERLQQSATRRRGDLEQARLDLEAQGHCFLDEMRLELQSIRQTNREAQAALDATRRQQERATASREPVPSVLPPQQSARVQPRSETIPHSTPPTEAAPAARRPEETPEQNAVIHATVRAENPGDRLIRYLQMTLSFKSAVLDELQEISEESIEPALSSTLGEHRQLTQRQNQEIEERLRALGAEPSGGGKGTLERLVGWMWPSRQREPDDYDRAIEGLLKALTAEQLEANLHHAVSALAAGVGDTQTAELADRHARQKQEAAEQLRPLLRSLPEQAVRVAEAMTQAVVAMAVAASEAEE